MLLWIILNGAGITAVAIWIWFRISHRHILRLCRAIPCAEPCYPVLGNALAFACSTEKFTENLFKIIEDSVLKGHRAVCCWIGAYPIVFITDPEDVKKIFNNALSRGKEMEASSRLYMSYGLVTAPVDHWKVTRPRLNLTFKPSNLEKLMPYFNLTSKRLVADLSDHVGGPQFDILPHAMHAAYMSIAFFLYGSKPESVVRSAAQFHDHNHGVELAAELMALRVLRPWLRNDFIFKLLYGGKIDSVKTYRRDNAEILNMMSVEEQTSEDDSEGLQDKFDGIETILTSMRGLQKRSLSVTDKHVEDEMNSFYAAGTDTIGTTVSSCILALACFPQIQAKLYAEIRSVLADNEDVVRADLRRLTYLNQVINETLRFFAVLPIALRAPIKDIDLGGYTIPADKTLYLCPTAVGYDPKYFPDPHKFDPERFSAENRSTDGVFMPFGRGPRNCIGKEYAMILTKVTVVHVVRNYRLTTSMDVHTPKKKYMITTTFCGGYNVSVMKRTK